MNRITRLIITLVIETVFMWNVNAQSGAVPLCYNQDIQCDLGVGLWGIPFPYDYDGDGLKDLVVSAPDRPYKGLYFFRNVGDPEHPVFDKAKKISPIGKNNVSYSEVDGKAFVLSKECEWVDFFENLYENPSKISYEGERLGESFKKSRSNMWSYVDWDNDGDKDIIVGIDTWDDYGWDNAFDSAGKWTNGPLHGYVYLLEDVDGKYVNRGKINAGGKPIDVYGAPVPCVGDFDGDGDLDIICGEFVDGLTWFENIGTRKVPEFAKGVRLSNKNGIGRAHV